MDFNQKYKMGTVKKITDKQFKKFLHSLGVPTFSLNFGWMLNGVCSDVLRWMYENVDHNNVLSAREELRYKELEEQGLLLSPEDLEYSIFSIKKQYESIGLPGDNDAMEDAELEIEMLEERLYILEYQKTVIADLKRQNMSTSKQLSLEIANLNFEHRQSKHMESAIAEECLNLAEEVETITNKLNGMIADKLDLCSSSDSKGNARKLFSFGPFETYEGLQTIFKIIFDSHTSKWNSKSVADTLSEADFVEEALVEAENMEDRLSAAISKYIISKLELSEEQAAMELASTSNDLPRRISSRVAKSKSTTLIRLYEESMLCKQLEKAVVQFLDERTSLAVEAAAGCDLLDRQLVDTELLHLLNTMECVLSLDITVLFMFDQELLDVEQLLQVLEQLMEYINNKSDVIRRIDHLEKTCSIIDYLDVKFRSSDALCRVLKRIFRTHSNPDARELVMMFKGMQHYMMELKGAIERGFRMKEKVIWELSDSELEFTARAAVPEKKPQTKKTQPKPSKRKPSESQCTSDTQKSCKDSTQYMSVYIWDGCSPRPDCWDSTVFELAKAVKLFEDYEGKRIKGLSDRVYSLEEADRVRRLNWQYFILDIPIATSIRRLRINFGRFLTERRRKVVEESVDEPETAEE